MSGFCLFSVLFCFVCFQEESALTKRAPFPPEGQEVNRMALVWFLRITPDYSVLMAHVWLKRPGKNEASVRAGCRWTSLNHCHFCMLTKCMFKSRLENFWVLRTVVKIYLLAGTLILFQAHISALANAGISTYFNQSDFWLRNYFILGASFCLLLFDLHGNLFFSCHSQWIFGVAGCVSFSSNPLLSISKALLGRDGI